MNYRRMDRSKVQYDFLVNRDYKAAYEDEIANLAESVPASAISAIFRQSKRQFRGVS